MRHRRIHIRVPVNGEATLFCQDGVVIQARTIDISAGGLRICNQARSLSNSEYDVDVTTIDGVKVNFRAVFIQQSDNGIGFKIVSIDKSNLQIIYDMVAAFQATDDFIKYIDKHEIINDWFIDENGVELEITFEVKG